MISLEEMKQYEPEMVALRRDIHAHPELGFDLPRTSALVAERLKSYGYQVVTGFVKCGVLGILDTGRPGKTIVFRADMDALPMPDETGAEYQSTVPGRAHACGHDAHTAILLGAAHYLADHRDALNGTLKVLFQPSEEGGNPSGAPLVVKSGVLDGADSIFGLHVDVAYECGQAAVRYGPLYSGSTVFDLTIRGRGGHGAYPHLAKDPIIVASQIINDAQTIVSRDTSPIASSVISFCTIKAGEARNVIPDTAFLGGTTRALDQEVMDRNIRMLERTAAKICELHDCQYELDHRILTPVLVNDAACTRIVEESAVSLLGRDHVICQPFAEMGAEDFAFYQEVAPSSFFILGVANRERGITHYEHHSKFDIDERAVAIGAGIFAGIAQLCLG